MSAWIPLVVALACAAEPEIEIVSDGPVLPPRGQPIISNEAYEVSLGALLDVEVRAGHGAGFALPRARLRSEALVETHVPLGMRLELEASPFADVASNLNGPGALRDAYILIGVGNRQVINLGELRLGQVRVPSSAHSLRAPEHWRFSQRPLAESLLLPGRDVGFVYHIDYGEYGVPLRVWVGNFAGTGPNRPRAELSPLVSARVEADLLRRRSDPLQVRLGLGLVFNSARPERPAVLVGDLRARARRLNFEAAWHLAGPSVSELHRRVGLRAEGGVEVLADFLELRLRYEALNTLGVDLEQRWSGAAVVTYLDDAFQVLVDTSLPGASSRGRSIAALTFRLWW